MGKCKYCGLSAGIFSKVHQECEEKHQKGLAEMSAYLRSFFQGTDNFSTVLTKKKQTEQDNFFSNEDWENACCEALRNYTDSIKPPISKQHLQTADAFLNNVGISRAILNKKGDLDKLSRRLYEGTLLAFFAENQAMSKIEQRTQMVTRLLPMSVEQKERAGLAILDKAANKFLSDGLISQQEQNQLDQFSHSLNLPTSNLPATYRGSSIEKIEQAAILRQLQNGQMPVTRTLNYPIMLTQGEYAIWAYDNVTMYQEKIVREWVNRRHGTSYRIMKGVYYHTGGSKGHPVEHSEMENLGKGALILTNKNIIFHSPTRTFKIPYKKLNGCTPYSDGIEIHQDSAKAQRQVFQGFDSWFMMNLLQIIQ